MEKKLLLNEDDCVDLVLSQTDDCLETTEEILGIEFARSNGEFVCDYKQKGKIDWDKVDELEELDSDVSKWRKINEEEHGLPTQFPCVAIYLFSKDFDRFGKVTTQILDFVYLSDFDQS